MAEIKQLSIRHDNSELDERTEDMIRRMCMKKGITFIEARDKVLGRRKNI